MLVMDFDDHQWYLLGRLSLRGGGRSLARPPLSLAERLLPFSCHRERVRSARTAGAE
jgi:hypothetical protein